MQRKGRVENINCSRREKSPVKRSGNTSDEVGAISVGRKALLHARVRDKWWKQLKKSVEVVVWEVGEESSELRWINPGGIKTLRDVFNDEIDDVYGICAGGATEINRRER